MLNYAETKSVSTIVAVPSDLSQTLISIAQKLHHEGNNVTATHEGDNQWKITSKDGTLSPIMVTDVQITALICHAADMRLKKVK